MTYAAVAQAVLDVAFAAIPAARQPDRAFVAHNAPAWELTGADQITVHVAPIAHTQQGTARAVQVVSLVTLHVQMVRCVPGFGSTSPLELGASAKALLDDFGAVERAVIVAAGTVFGRGTPVTFGNAVPLGPSGNVAGWD